MGERTEISWADSTFNPWVGCQKVSAACDHCYAETLMDTRLGRVEWGPGKPRKRTSEAYWREPHKWNRKAEASGKPWRVFCASLADVFDNAVPPEWRADLWQLIDDTPHLTWMLLTKRPENIRKMVPFHSWQRNVWLGTTAEDQASLDRRWPHLAAERVLVRFLSCEPLLSPLDLSQCLYERAREGVSGTTCPRGVRRRAGRVDLASGEMDGRRREIGLDSGRENSGGAEHQRPRRISSGDVQGRGLAQNGECSPDNLDVGESPANSEWDADQPRGRKQEKQSPLQSRIGHGSAERAALPRPSFSQEKGSERNPKLASGGDRRAGHRDSHVVAGQGDDAAGVGRKVPDYSIDGFCDRSTQELGTPALAWCITGGESGHGARPSHPDWFRSVRDQCVAAGIPYLHKQNGEWVWYENMTYDEAECLATENCPGKELQMHSCGNTAIRVGKSKAGRLLDGRTWDEMPGAAA